MPDDDGSAELPCSDPDWGGTSATAMAEPPSATANPHWLPENKSSPAEIVDEVSRWRPSTAVLGGCFASVIFHFWLLAMLSSLGIDRSIVSDEPAIDSSLFEEEKSPDEPEEPLKFELAEPKDKEDEIREAAEATSIGRERVAEPRIQPLASVSDSFDIARIGMAGPAQFEVISQG